MKFQNHSFKIFLGRTDTRTDGRTNRKQYAPHFFKLWGHNEGLIGISLRLFPLSGRIRKGCTFTQIVPLFIRVCGCQFL